jgi:hypothetical protein
VGSKTIAANTLKVGTFIRVTAAGIIGCTGTPNLILKFAVGSTTDEFYNDLMPTDFDGRWRVVLELCVNSIGAGGTFSGMVTFFTGQSGGGFVNEGTVSVNYEFNSDAIDTTASNAINLTAQWGTADAANTVTCVVSSLEILNATS